jgi:hypothetical protein
MKWPRPGGRGRGTVRLSRESSGCRSTKSCLGRITLKVTHDRRRITVEVTSDGEGLVSHAGSALLAQVADKTGLTRALSRDLGPLQLRAGSHDRGRVIRDLAVMLADGGDCLADIAVVRDQATLFGRAASDSTAFRVIDQIASHPEAIGWLRAAHARARARVWKLAGAPDRVTIDVDATLLTAHSDKEGAEPTWKRGYGFHPMSSCCCASTPPAPAISCWTGVAKPRSATPSALI